MAAGEALGVVRMARPHSVETAAQEAEQLTLWQVIKAAVLARLRLALAA